MPINTEPQSFDPEALYKFSELPKSDFTYVSGTETHTIRRQMILKKHPEISELMKPTSNITIYITLALVAVQLTVMYFVRNASWPVFLLINYWVGGTLAHSSHVLMHDLTHLVGHPNPTVNRLLAILCNVACGIPSAISFGKYHADHHNFLGEYGNDPDLPFVVEARHINTTFRKFLFLFFIPLVYALRPVFFLTKKTEFLEFVNFFTILVSNFLIYYFMGRAALGYILVCGFLSIGFHPSALHVLAEHFEVVKGMETYDYLGFWNFLGLNIGYHTEHHDFPMVPWYNLPKVREIAKEFYEHLPYHTSYVKLAWRFVFDENFGLYNRTIRENPKDKN